jgi:hypothetical protein
MTETQRFHELTGGCWHEWVEKTGYVTYCKKCLSAYEEIPTYDNPADILKRMRDYCGEERYKDFLNTISESISPYAKVIDIYYIENAPALLRKACEWLENK